MLVRAVGMDSARLKFRLGGLSGEGVFKVFTMNTTTHKDNETDTEEFIPTLECWAELYDEWFNPLVKDLRQHASEYECQEAVHMAFLKVLGLSQNLKLHKPLEPKTLDQWYGFIWWQARGVLSNLRGKSARYVHMPEYVEACIPAWSTNRVSRLDRLRRAICEAVEEVCKGWKDAEAKSKAFVMFSLDEKSAEEVVAEIPEALNANNLYQITKRIRSALAEEARKPGSALWELRSA